MQTTTARAVISGLSVGRLGSHKSTFSVWHHGQFIGSVEYAGRDWRYLTGCSEGDFWGYGNSAADALSALLAYDGIKGYTAVEIRELASFAIN